VRNDAAMTVGTKLVCMELGRFMNDALEPLLHVDGAVDALLRSCISYAVLAYVHASCPPSFGGAAAAGAATGAGGAADGGTGAGAGDPLADGRSRRASASADAKAVSANLAVLNKYLIAPAMAIFGPSADLARISAALIALDVSGLRALWAAIAYEDEESGGGGGSSSPPPTLAVGPTGGGVGTSVASPAPLPALAVAIDGDGADGDCAAFVAAYGTLDELPLRVRGRLAAARRAAAGGGAGGG